MLRGFNVGLLGFAIVFLVIMFAANRDNAAGFVDIWVDDTLIAQRAGINIQGLNGISATSTDNAANSRVDVGLDGSAFPTAAFTTMAAPAGTNPVATSTGATLAFAEFPGIDIFGTSTSNILNFAFDLSEVDLTNAVALGTDTTGDYVESITQGSAITVTGGSGEASTPSIAFNPTGVNDTTWGDGSEALINWTFNGSSGTDPRMDAGNGQFTFQNDVISNAGLFGVRVSASNVGSCSNASFNWGPTEPDYGFYRESTAVNVCINGTRHFRLTTSGFETESTSVNFQVSGNAVFNVGNANNRVMAFHGTRTNNGDGIVLRSYNTSAVITDRITIEGWSDVADIEIDNSRLDLNDNIIHDVGNLGIGLEISSATSTKTLYIADGTAPVAGFSNTGWIYADDVAGTTELFACDEAGNCSNISPHRSDFTNMVDLACDFPWVFNSENTYIGEGIWVDFCQALLDLQAITGKTYIHTYATATQRNWYGDQVASRERVIAERQRLENHKNALQNRLSLLLAIPLVNRTADDRNDIENLRSAIRRIVLPEIPIIKDPPKYLYERNLDLKLAFCARNPRSSDCQ